MNIFKRLLFALMLVSLSTQSYGFTDGTVLTAAQLNSAFANAAITSGTISGASVAATTLSATVANPSINYQSPATGSVPRSYQSKLGDTVSVLDFAGCDPTGVADSTTCLQNAINATQGSANALFIPSGLYKTSAPLTINAPLEIDGVYSTWQGTAGSISASSVKGTVLYFAHLGQGIVINGSVGGVTLNNFGTLRNQPTPTAAWTPIAADYDIYGTSGQNININNIELINPTNGIQFNSMGGGKANIYNLRMQAFKVGIYMDAIYDTAQISRVHQWPFWSNDSFTAAYTEANLDTIYFLRVDNPFLSDIFSIFARSGMRFGQSATGVTQKLKLINGDFDRGKYAIWVDSTITAGSFIGQFDNVTSQPETGLAGSEIIKIDGNSSTIYFGNLRAELAGLSSVDVAGTGNSVVISNAYLNNWNNDNASANMIKVAAGNFVHLTDTPIGTGANGGATYSTTGTITVGPSNFYGAKSFYGNGSGNALTISDTTNASGVQMVMTGNGVTTPTKYIRVNGGNLQVVNNAYSAVILGLSDTGNLTLGTPLSISQGGTGATTTAAALTSLGAASAPLSATTVSIGGAALVAGACASATTTVTGATTAMVVNTSPTTYPGDGNIWESYISAANTVITKVCAIVAGTPVASTYNVRVSQ